MVRPTQQGHIRQRPLIHILLRKGPRPTTGDQTKRVLSVPPPNRQTMISSISSTERGEVFYGPTDWLGSRDPMTPVRYTRGSSTGLAD
jgi:hypothetical protein